jgi:hypothetical protein
MWVPPGSETGTEKMFMTYELDFLCGPPVKFVEVHGGKKEWQK